MELNVAQLARLEPIRALSPERLREIAGFCRAERHAIGADPLRGGWSPAELVYLVDGELKISLPGGGSRMLVGGCDQANWPLGQKTAAPVASKAITQVELLRIDRELLDIMMTWDQLSSATMPPETAKTEEVTRWRAMSGMFQTRTLTAGALARLPSAHLHELMRRFERVKVKRGTIVVSEGEEGDFYYVIESGRCEVTRAVGGARLHVAELMAGDAFGEEALVAGERRNATVRMKTDGVLWQLAKPDFIELLQAPLLHGIGIERARQRLADGRGAWIDVRYPAEYAENGLPGAINIPLNEIRTAFGVLDPGREYVVYCQSGRRSSAAAFLLAQHGLKAAWLEGGLDGLKESK